MHVVIYLLHFRSRQSTVHSIRYRNLLRILWICFLNCQLARGPVMKNQQTTVTKIC